MIDLCMVNGKDMGKVNRMNDNSNTAVVPPAGWLEGMGMQQRISVEDQTKKCIFLINKQRR
jgi:hypothetical protein